MSLAAPFGGFLTQFDTAITAAQSTAVSGMVSAMQPVLGSMAVIYFAFMGWRVARGDLQLVHDFTVHMAKIGFIFYVATNLTVFNTWVVQTYSQGIPNAMARAVAGVTGSSTSVTGVAASLDQIWALMWSAASTAWGQAGRFDVASKLIAALSIMGGGIGLLLCAGVYLISRFLLAIVVVLGPVAIGCAMFGATRPIFERWIGKGVALIVLQVSAVITMQIVLSGDTAFMTPLANGASLDLPTQLQNLISMAFWLALGAFAIYSLPAMAYSIGTGVAVSMLPLLGAALAGAEVAGAAAGAVASGPWGSPLGGGGDVDFNLSLARAELGGPSGEGFLAPPPPPALPYASPPLLTHEG